MRTGARANTRSMALSFSQFGPLPRLRRTSHLRHRALAGATNV